MQERASICGDSAVIYGNSAAILGSNPYFALTTLLFRAAINHGNSGGPVVNLNGEVSQLRAIAVFWGLVYFVPSLSFWLCNYWFGAFFAASSSTESRIRCNQVVGMSSMKAAQVWLHLRCEI